MLHLASLFIFHQAGLPEESAPYGPTKEKDLRSSVIKALSILKTSAKVSALSPVIFMSKNLDRDWMALYSQFWFLEASRQPGGVWGIIGVSCLMPLLDMLPTMAQMVNMRGTCNRATDLMSWLPSAQIAVSVIISINLFLSTIGARQALASPSLSLAVLTSQPAWRLLAEI